MADIPSFRTPTGHEYIKDKLKQAIPQWPNGPHDWQIEATANVLCKIDQLIIAGCGEGKTAAMYLHVLLHRILCENPDLPRFGLVPKEQPVVLDVTPLTDLAQSQVGSHIPVHEIVNISAYQVAEMNAMGIPAISLDKKTVELARSEENRNVYREIERGHWRVVISSPERLKSPELGRILRNDAFINTLSLLSLDEAHVADPWSKDFRVEYDVGSLCLVLRGRVPILLMTATLTQEGEARLLRLTGLREKAFVTIRRPIERPNMRLVFRTLRHGIGPKVKDFPDIAWAARGAKKVVIFVGTHKLAIQVASYLWRLRPPDEAQRRRNIRIYTGVTEEGKTSSTIMDDFVNDPETFVVVATIKFGMGVDSLRNIAIAVNFGIPRTPETLLQQLCRAGRDPNMFAAGITYVQGSYVSAAEDTMELDDLSEGDELENDSRRRSAVGPDRSGRDTAPMNHPKDSDSAMANGGIRRLVRAHARRECLVVEINRLFAGPSPPSHALASCLEAKRVLPCSSCIHHLPPSRRPPLLMTAPLPGHTPRTQDLTDEHGTEAFDDDDAPDLVIKHPKLTQEFALEAGEELDEFCQMQWSLKQSSDAAVRPWRSYLGAPLRAALLKDFHRVRDREELARILIDWRYLDEDGSALCNLARRLNQEFDERREQVLEERARKAAATRAAKKQGMSVPSLTICVSTEDFIKRNKMYALLNRQKHLGANLVFKRRPTMSQYPERPRGPATRFRWMKTRQQHLGRILRGDADARVAGVWWTHPRSDGRHSDRWL
ncbi:P-loop containing nucleoside triphosphate hydrolase protein [Amylostereum chailletii]|nr:P-loop containing nucleoside triphosphate hydrolase protein [Amylostereum chailletii]